MEKDKDPIEVLKENAWPEYYDAQVKTSAALAELERRAKIEARRDVWIAAGNGYSLRPQVIGGVSVTLIRGRDGATASGSGVDYYDAMSKALAEMGA